MHTIPIRIVLILTILTLLNPSSLLAAMEQRTALVIGNSNYIIGPLKNPANDASDMAEALRKLGFTVILKKNAKQEEMEEAVRDFGLRLKRGGVGLFFYAGHGLQISGRNYLIPIGVKIEREMDAKYKAIDVEMILDEMANAGNPMNIVILDACRDNPLGRSIRSTGRGLAIISDAPKGTFLTYSTSPGKTAADGEGRNSPYTAALLKSIKEPGLPIEQVFKRVRQKLSRETGDKQIPWELSSLQGDFYFVSERADDTKIDLKPRSEELNSDSPGPRSQTEPERQAVAMGARPPLPPADEKTFISPTLGAKFVLIPAGTFMMGWPATETLESTFSKQHRVTISKAFYLQATEVTQGQWERVMKNNPSFFKNCGDDCPVENVSWNEVQEFIHKLNQIEGTDKYRLPTEAQWEYAARSGGKEEKWAGTDHESRIDEYVWYNANSGRKTHPVGQKKPNGLGLYDMSGNILEWVQDWWQEYPSGHVTDPVGSLPGAHPVVIVRGGNWGGHSNDARTKRRGSLGPDTKYFALGFRLARSIPVEASLESRREENEGRTYKDPTTGMEFVFVRGGCYKMGDSPVDRYEHVHEVCVDDFYMGKYHVTVSDFNNFVNETGYSTEAEKGKGCYVWKGTGLEGAYDRNKTWRNPGFIQDERHPVVCVSWNDAKAFADWMTQKSGRIARLPKEAEWEFAARERGRRVLFGTGADIISADTANYNATKTKSYSEPGQYRGKTTPVGSFKPNGIGLYDMAGNVYQWCQDWYLVNYYSSSPKNNPAGPVTGPGKVQRGGSWHSSPSDLCSAGRGWAETWSSSVSAGFRLVTSAQ